MTTRAEEIAGEEYPDTTGPDGETIYMEGQRQVFVNGYKQGQQDRWIPIAEAPKNGSIVTVGHVAGWIEPDILFRDGHFYKRVNHLTGGDAGFKQKDWKKPDGNPASPDEWPWGPELFPTHYQPLPPNPEQR